jgi:hypothetical protein
MNHEGRGQNVMFENFTIKFITGGNIANLDDIFVSDRNVVEAGMGRDDAVIGNSHSSPFILIRSGGW